MKDKVVTFVRKAAQQFGIDIVRYDDAADAPYPPDFTDFNIGICDAVKPYTMTSPERVNALVDAVRYVVANKIEGAMVECGVWKGGSSMAMALTLKEMGRQERDLFLYDTFSGMPTPTDADVSYKGYKGETGFAKTQTSDDSSTWCCSPLDEVQRNVLGTGYPADKLHFIEGKVEDTIPAHLPGKIALLRLDTDWYESTKHELVHLFPLLQVNGILIIDDYGHWEGAKKAVDEYFAENGTRIILHRIDYTGRIAVKTQ